MTVPKRNNVLFAALAVATVVAYRQAFHAGFVNFDDPSYFSENDHVLRGLTWENLRWAWTAFDNSNWHPLTWISYFVDAAIGGGGPFVPHATNVLWHLANSLLAFVALSRLTGSRGRSFFVAAVFAVHPVHVESVAWISERKDLLSAFFGLLCLIAYERYARRPEWRAYSLVPLTLALSLLCKPMLVTMPFLLGIVDFWPLRRRWSPRLVVEKLPLLALAAGSSAVTWAAQRGAIELFPELTPALRAGNALLSYMIYLEKIFLPMDLAAFYPHPVGTLSLPLVLLAAFALAAISVAAWRTRRSHPFFLAGWLWYLGCLVPVLGLVQVGYQGRADRYLYFPIIGVLMIAGWGVPELFARWRKRLALPADALPKAAVFALVTLLLLADHQASTWVDSLTLWTHALRVAEQPGSDLFMIRTNFAEALVAAQRINEATDQLVKVVADCKGRRCMAADISLGRILRRLGEQDRALGYFEKAYRDGPREPAAAHDLGFQLMLMGRNADALRLLEEAKRDDPKGSGLDFDIATVQKRIGNDPAARAAYTRGLKQDPDYPLRASTHALDLARTEGDGEEALLRARQFCLLNGCATGEGKKLLEKVKEEIARTKTPVSPADREIAHAPIAP